MAVVGIDLGTTKSAVAILRGKGPEMIPNREGDRITPSVVGLSKTGEVWVGKKPKESRLILKEGPIEEVKRLMGTAERIPFSGRDRSPQEISALILRSIVADAEAYLGESINAAVITIPAYFNEPERRATREAGELAGLHVGAVLDEPTAAAMAYGLNRSVDETVLIYDLGGGTFDVSVLQVAENHFEVLAISGNKRLGGKDFDRRLAGWVVSRVRQNHGVDLTQDKRAMHKIALAVERAKKDLSNVPTTHLLVEAVTPDLDIDLQLTRAEFEGLIRDYIDSTIPCIEEALGKAELKAKDIGRVVLIGGSTRIPLVQQVVKQHFGKDPLRDINPDEAVALGAAVFTSALDPEALKKGVAAVNPQAKAESFAPPPDIPMPTVVPRTPHPLGVGLMGNRLGTILPGNSFYPIEVTGKDYCTTHDDQRLLEVPIYEGDNPVASENTPLGVVRLDLPPGLKEGTAVWISFNLNESRILEVTVELPNQPGLRVKSEIRGTGDIPKEERERIIREAREQLRRERGPYAAGKMLIEDARAVIARNADKLGATRVRELEAKIRTLETAMEGGVADHITKAVEELDETLTQARLSLM